MNFFQGILRLIRALCLTEQGESLKSVTYLARVQDVVDILQKLFNDNLQREAGSSRKSRSSQVHGVVQPGSSQVQGVVQPVTHFKLTNIRRVKLWKDIRRHYLSSERVFLAIASRVMNWKRSEASL